MEFACAADVVLELAEIGKHVPKRPPGIAAGRPVIVVLALPADVDQAVDRRRSAQRPAARPVDLAARSCAAPARFGSASSRPGGTWSSRSRSECESMDRCPAGPASSSRTEWRAVRGQAVGEDASGGARARRSRSRRRSSDMGAGLRIRWVAFRSASLAKVGQMPVRGRRGCVRRAWGRQGFASPRPKPRR